jgi:hypothetical protein
MLHVRHNYKLIIMMSYCVKTRRLFSLNINKFNLPNYVTGAKDAHRPPTCNNTRLPRRAIKTHDGREASSRHWVVVSKQLHVPTASPRGRHSKYSVEARLHRESIRRRKFPVAVGNRTAVIQHNATLIASHTDQHVCPHCSGPLDVTRVTEAQTKFLVKRCTDRKANAI